MIKEWHAGGRYGYWMVDEYRPEDGCNGTYGSIGEFRSQKLAKQVAGALNAAFEAGRQHERSTKE